MTNNSKFIAELKLKNIYQDFFIDTDLERFEYDKPHYYFNYFWEQYQQFRDSQRGEDGSASGKWNNLNGQAFGIIMGFLLDREGFQIVAMDEKFPRVDLVQPDFVLQHGHRYSFLSIKTSSRERWKQADWEAIKFKRAYPKTKCFLILIKPEEVRTIKTKLHLLDLDDVVSANSVDLDEMFVNMKAYTP